MYTGGINSSFSDFRLTSMFWKMPEAGLALFFFFWCSSQKHGLQGVLPPLLYVPVCSGSQSLQLLNCVYKLLIKLYGDWNLTAVCSELHHQKQVCVTFLSVGQVKNMHFVYIICSWTPFYKGTESLTHLISMSSKTVTYILNFKVNCSLQSLRSLKWNTHPRKAELITTNLKKM